MAVVLLTPDGERSIISQDDEVTTAHVAEAARTVRDAGTGWFYLVDYRFPEAAEAAARDGAGVVYGWRFDRVLRPLEQLVLGAFAWFRWALRFFLVFSSVHVRRVCRSSSTRPVTSFLQGRERGGRSRKESR
ncbi:hypothetical protein [Actinomadura fibrosa]|uniref:Uncharacterized protein n=1 Tax=Actinomadura fibrosa TaxID=111802 RepID=A0ABW2XNU8_9ACTN|nr:hypothetical protein [Actinomadura fibrosa]